MEMQMANFHFNCFSLFGLILVKNIIVSQSFPLKVLSNQESNVTDIGAAAVLPFLKRFGYLEGNVSLSHESDTLFTQESVGEAIKEMQKFGALPQTGIIDNATLELLTKARCGVPDIISQRDMNRRKKRYIIGANGWNKRRLSYRIENWAPQLSESSVSENIRKAFKIWADYAQLRFISSPRRSNYDVDISISFGRGYHGDGYPFDGSGGTLAHAFFPHGHGSLAGDIHFDLDENWSSKQDAYVEYNPGSPPYSFLAVAVHEIGHSLGLSHSASQDSVMFPYYQYPEEGEDHENIRLGYDDIMAMYQLYIQRSIQEYPEDDDNQSPTSDTSTTQEMTTYSTSTSYSTTTERVEATTKDSGTVPTSTVQSTTVVENSTPNLCLNGYDTISFIRNELFVFKDEFMWRFRSPGVSDAGYPIKTSHLFPMLKNVPFIDAAFENSVGEIYIFSGNRYWVYLTNENITSGYLTDFGLPQGLHKIDGAFIWNKNDKLYFFSDSSYWKYNMPTKMMEEGYPKRIDRWRGIPYSGIDSVFTWSDGQSYFFKNDEYWRFDDAIVHTDEGYPRKTSSFWFGC